MAKVQSQTQAAAVNPQQKAFDNLMSLVKTYKPMAEAFVGDYKDPRTSPLQVGTVSTQTLGSVPIFGAGAPVIPVENLDKMYLLQQQAKLRKEAEDAAIMGQALPYYKLATSNASKAFNATVNTYIQGQFSKNFGAFAGEPDAAVKARKATNADLGFHTKLNDYSALADQWNKLYEDMIVFTSGMGDTKKGKKAEYIPPTLKRKFDEFVAMPENMFLEASKHGDVDLISVGERMDNLRAIMTPFDDVSASVKAYVDELAKTVGESAPKKIRSTNRADMLMTIKREFYEAKPEEYAQRIYDAHYASIPKDSQDGKDLMHLVTKMVDDQIANSITNTLTSMTNDRLGAMEFEYRKRKEMPVPTTYTMGYNVKDSQGNIHTRRVAMTDFITTKQRPIKATFSGQQILYDPATNRYIVPYSGVETSATVSGFGTFRKKFGSKEANFAMQAFGGGQTWNGASNQVGGNVAVVSLGSTKSDVTRVTQKVPTGQYEMKGGKRVPIYRTEAYQQPQTIKVKVYDPHTDKWTTEPNYNVTGKQFITDSRHVVGNVAATDESVNLWLQEQGGQLPASYQISAKRKPPTK